MPRTYDPWQDRPDKDRARPTRERLARGSYRLAESKDAGRTYAIDDASTPLRRAYVDGALPVGLVYAGERFEALGRSQTRRGPRSSLDFTPRGHSEGETEYQARRAIEWRDLWAIIGHERMYILIAVCIDHEATGPRRKDARRWARLLDGLEQCRAIWGIALDGED